MERDLLMLLTMVGGSDKKRFKKSEVEDERAREEKGETGNLGIVGFKREFIIIIIIFF